MLPARESLVINYTDSARYNSQIAVAYGSIACDGIEYEYYLLMQKLPLADTYVYRQSSIIITDEGQDIAFFGQPHWFFGRINIIVNGSDKTVSGSIEANAGKIIGCLIIFFGVSYGQYRKLKKTREGIATSGNAPKP